MDDAMIDKSLGILLAALAPAAAQEDSMQPDNRKVTVVPNRNSGHDLADFQFNGALTRAEVVARWGDPYMFGPDGSIATYQVEDITLLWLSFSPEPPHRLTRAVVMGPGNYGPGRILYDTLDIMRTRRLDQIDLSRPRTVEEVNAAWGPPDGLTGSGEWYWIYALADGRRVEISFSPGGMTHTATLHDGAEQRELLPWPRR